MQPRNLVSNYTVKFSSEGWKRLNRLDNRIVKRIMDKIETLSSFRSLNTIKKMEGKLRNNYRMRVGDIRVIFDVDEENKIVWVVDMGFRGGVYR